MILSRSLVDRVSMLHEINLFFYHHASSPSRASTELHPLFELDLLKLNPTSNSNLTPKIIIMIRAKI
jgi:hypothetical protein